jgi:hypothetical protein
LPHCHFVTIYGVGTRKKKREVAMWQPGEKSVS